MATVARLGARLPRLMTAAVVAESPLVSVTVATHSMVSLRAAMFASNVRLALVPSVVPCVRLFQTYVVVVLWVSASEATTLHVRVLSL